MPERRPCDCGSANVFSSREARNDLKRYLEKGPDETTQALIDAIIGEGVEGASLLDIGGGIGAIQLGLLGAGAARATSIDATDAYVETARGEAERRGYGGRVAGRLGDFVELAPTVEEADVVTLDRVICCYPDLARLLGSAAGKARRSLGLVYPRPTWWNRIAARGIAAWGWLTRDPTRWYLFTDAAVDGLLRAAGFERREVSRSFIWQVVLYRRAAGS